jgi:hypothetical protein
LLLAIEEWGKWAKEEFLARSSSGTVVKHSIHNPKIEGLNLAPGYWREGKRAKIELL